jgi:tRNA(Ile)-lysidine synthase
MNKLIYRVNTNIREYFLLKKDEKILVAVSGGQDSISLLHILIQLKNNWNWSIGVIYCDHQIRFDSYQNSYHMASIVQNLNLKYYQAITPYKLLTEEKARAWRYKVLTEIALAENYTSLIIAHTASDRIETFLLNLFRGAGLQGVKGICWKKKLNENFFLIRPLLNLTRKEIYDYVKKNNLPIWPDTTNQSLIFKRNKIRKKLLPFLRKNFNLNIDKALLQFSEISYQDDLFLKKISMMSINNLCSSTSKKIQLNTLFLHSLPLSIQRRIIKYIFQNYLSIILTFSDIEKVRCSSLNKKQIISFFLKKKVFVSIHSKFVNIYHLKWDARDSNPELVG